MTHEKGSYVKWVSEALDGRLKQQIERLRNAKDVRHVRIMPDVHLANDVCIGCVIGTSHLIYPAAIGSDIGCGMLAQAFDVQTDVVKQQQALQILRGFNAQIPIIKHHKAPKESIDVSGLSCDYLQHVANREGKIQLGTLGRGNHFLEVQEDDATGQLWIMIHTGSRAVGPAIRKHHESLSPTKSGGMHYVDSDSDQGKALLQDIGWARAYAKQNRRLILGEVQAVMNEILGVSAINESLIECDHNHVQQEVFDGEALWVHRKGASSAHAGSMAIIPGSMGTPSFHVKGLGNEDSLCSSSHGSGRCMSREEARSRITKHKMLKEMEGTFFESHSLNALVEEAPSAYKDVLKVMKAQKKLVAIKRKLKPIISYKG